MAFYLQAPPRKGLKNTFSFLSGGYLPGLGVPQISKKVTGFPNRKEGPRDTPLPLMDDKTSPKTAFFYPDMDFFSVLF